jgi:hypothetical protein
MEDLRVSRLLAGALAAITGAVVASSMGFEGTLAGAAVMSIFMAVTTALYTHSLAVAQQRMRRVVARRVSGAADGGESDAGPIRWQRVGIAAAVVFAVALGAITAVEVAAGQPLASLLWDRPQPRGSTSVGVVATEQRRSTRAREPSTTSLRESASTTTVPVAVSTTTTPATTAPTTAGVPTTPSTEPPPTTRRR